MSKQWFYHWTHKSNLTKILKKGIDPNKSEGKQLKVWVACYSRIAWALAHVSQSHGWDADDMVCLRINAHRVEFQRTAMDGVFTTKMLITPLQIDAILMRIGEAWEQPIESHEQYREAYKRGEVQ